MSDPAVIAELQAAGVDVTLEDDPAVVLDRLQVRIVDVVTAGPEAFDRALYTRLMALSTSLQSKTEDADTGA